MAVKSHSMCKCNSGLLVPSVNTIASGVVFGILFCHLLVLNLLVAHLSHVDVLDLVQLTFIAFALLLFPVFLNFLVMDIKVIVPSLVNVHILSLIRCQFNHDQ